MCSRAQHCPWIFMKNGQQVSLIMRLCMTAHKYILTSPTFKVIYWKDMGEEQRNGSGQTSHWAAALRDVPHASTSSVPVVTATSPAPVSISAAKTFRSATVVAPIPSHPLTIVT